MVINNNLRNSIRILISENGQADPARDRITGSIGAAAEAEVVNATARRAPKRWLRQWRGCAPIGTTEVPDTVAVIQIITAAEAAEAAEVARGARTIFRRLIMATITMATMETPAGLCLSSFEVAFFFFLVETQSVQQ